MLRRGQGADAKEGAGGRHPGGGRIPMLRGRQESDTEEEAGHRCQGGGRTQTPRRR